MDVSAIHDILIELELRPVIETVPPKDVLVREINGAFTDEQLATLNPEDLDLSI